MAFIQKPVDVTIYPTTDRAVRLILARNGCAFLLYQTDFDLVCSTRAFAASSIHRAYTLALNHAKSNNYQILEINLSEQDFPIFIVSVCNGIIPLPCRMHPSLDTAFPFFNLILTKYPNTRFTFPHGYDKQLLAAAAAAGDISKFRVPHTIDVAVYLTLDIAVVATTDTVASVLVTRRFNRQPSILHAYLTLAPTLSHTWNLTAICIPSGYGNVTLPCATYSHPSRDRFMDALHWNVGRSMYPNHAYFFAPHTVTLADIRNNKNVKKIAIDHTPHIVDIDTADFFAMATSS